jgi:hypothetical protein
LSFPLGVLIGLILLKFKSTKDTKVRFVALIFGFLFILYTPFVSPILMQGIVSKSPTLSSINSNLKQMYPNSTISFLTLDSGKTVFVPLNSAAKTQPIPTQPVATQISVTLAQKDMFTNTQIQQIGDYICKNSKYDIVSIKARAFLTL